MIKWPFIFSLCCSCINLWSQKLQLATPRVNTMVAMTGNNKPVVVRYDFRMPGADLRFTTDGSEPGKKSQKYRDSLIVTRPCVLRARAFHRDFLPSEIVTTEVVSSGKKVSDFDVKGYSEQYKALGKETLFDREFGSTNFRQHYLGFTENAEIEFATYAEDSISNVHISILVDQPAWIFGPQSVKVLDSDDIVLARIDYFESMDKNKAEKLIKKIVIPRGKHQSLKLVVEPVRKLPEWHQGRGNGAWIFIDEIWIE